MNQICLKFLVERSVKSQEIIQCGDIMIINTEQIQYVLVKLTYSQLSKIIQNKNLCIIRKLQTNFFLKIKLYVA